MKVLVTGAAGFIGSHTSERLLAAGHQVTGYDCFDATLYSEAAKRRNIDDVVAGDTRGSYRLVEADIGDASVLRSTAEGHDVICHLAALAGVRPSLEQPARYVRTNVEGTTNVFEAARSVGIDRIVMASSSSVYGARDGGSAFSETDSCIECLSPYGASKRATELMGMTFSHLYGLGITALRYFTVYGPRQRPDMAINKFIDAAVTGVPVPLYGDGSSRRDYTYVDDIVSGTVAAIDAVAAGEFSIYNLGGTQTTGLAELIDIIEDVTGRTVPVDRLPDQPGDVPITHADIAQAAARLGYAPTTDVRTGITKYWQWIQQRT